MESWKASKVVKDDEGQVDFLIACFFVMISTNYIRQSVLFSSKESGFTCATLELIIEKKIFPPTELKILKSQIISSVNIHSFFKKGVKVVQMLH